MRPPTRSGALVATSRRVPKPGNGSFRILHAPPSGPIEARWRACLDNSDFATHYTAPAFFLEPMLRNRRAFAVLSIDDQEVTGVITGINDGNLVQSGLSVRPQIALSRHADRTGAMANLMAGLLVEAEAAKLVDLFLWPDIGALAGPRFHRRPYDGVVMLDLSQGPDALFRKFSENRRSNIKKAIKYGVSVEPASSRDEIAAYYAICVAWSRRKGLPIAAPEQFQQTFALTDNRLLLLARHQGNIIAGLVIRYLTHGVMEYAANSSLESALRLRPNDLLHWRAIEWGWREGITKYSLGGTHLFLRKFGGEIVPTTRLRLDLSLLHRFTIGDWIADQAQRARLGIPHRLRALGRFPHGFVKRPPVRSFD